MTKTNKLKTLMEVEKVISKIYPTLLAMVTNGVIRNPLDDYLVVNYPPRSVSPKISGKEKLKFLNMFFDKINNCEKDTKFSIYIQIPFCTRRCSFCHFYLIPGDFYRQKLEETIELMKKEIKLVGRNIRKRKGINSIFFGGGSPSLLSADQVSDILNSLKEIFDFDKHIEITLEIHPEILRLKPDVDKYFSKLKNIGITRLNIGLETSNENILKLSNRGHTLKEAIAVFKKAQKYNFILNIDLMWGGLVLDTAETFFDSLDLAFSLNPDTVTTYFMWLKPGCVDFVRYKDKPHLYPNWIEIVRQRFLAHNIAKKYGYRQELVDWFRRKFSKGFQQQKEKWGSNNTVLIPFGPGTYGWVFLGYQKNIMYYNPFDLRKYTKVTSSGD